MVRRIWSNLSFRGCTYDPYFGYCPIHLLLFLNSFPCPSNQSLLTEVQSAELVTLSNFWFIVDLPFFFFFCKCTKLLDPKDPIHCISPGVGKNIMITITTEYC